MKLHDYGCIIARENETVNETDIIKLNKMVGEKLRRYSKFDPKHIKQFAPVYANRIRTWDLGLRSECEGLEGEVLYIGDGIEYFFFSCTDNLKKIYIPSSVKDIRKSIYPDSKISELNNVYFDVSESNPYYSSENGSLYTKDFSKLIHFHSGKGVLNPKCNEIGKNCGYICSKKNDELKDIKVLRRWSCINIGDDEFNVPENVEVIDDDFLIYTKTNKVHISASVKIIGDLKKYCLTVSQNSKTFSSDKNGNLYTAEGKTFLQGTTGNELQINEGCEEVNLTYCNCKKMYIPESVNKVCGNRKCNIKFSVSENNKSFSVYENSLYSKDFSELIELCANSEIIHIHNNCKKIRDGAFGDNEFGELIERIRRREFKKISCPEELKNDEKLRKILEYIG